MLHLDLERFSHLKSKSPFFPFKYPFDVSSDFLASGSRNSRDSSLSEAPQCSAQLPNRFQNGQVKLRFLESSSPIRQSSTHHPPSTAIRYQPNPIRRRPRTKMTSPGTLPVPNLHNPESSLRRSQHHHLNPRHSSTRTRNCGRNWKASPGAAGRRHLSSRTASLWP